MRACMVDTGLIRECVHGSWLRVSDIIFAREIVNSCNIIFVRETVTSCEIIFAQQTVNSFKFQLRLEELDLLVLIE